MEQAEMAVIARALESAGVEDAEEKALKIGRYLEMLRGRREWAGLVSRSTSEEPARAVAESLSVLAAATPQDTRVVEIGSGGGLLGLVLSVARPGWDVTMVESSGRKAAFLAEAAGALRLENATVVNARAETLVGSRFDICVSRAAGRLGEMAEVALPLLRPGGRYIALKQSDPSAELTSSTGAVRSCGGEIVDVISHSRVPDRVPESVSLVVIEKL